MRVVSIFLFIGLYISAFSQDTFSNQLTKILADTPNYFSSIKGELKTIRKLFDYKDSVFYSKIDLVGLRETEYHKGGNIYSIQGLIVDSVNERRGKRNLKKWKNNVRSVLGKSFTIWKNKIVNPADHSWVFIRDKVEITILLERLLDEKNYPYFYTYFSIEVFNEAEWLKENGKE